MDGNADHAVAYQKWVDDIGTIDAIFRYHPPPKGNLQVEGIIRTFRWSLPESIGNLPRRGSPREKSTGRWSGGWKVL
jgi:hypothetical protein